MAMARTPRSRSRVMIIGTSWPLIRAWPAVRFGPRGLPALDGSFRIGAQGEVLRQFAGVAGDGSAIRPSLLASQVRFLHRSLRWVCLDANRTSAL
jgi:hypothetical protein